MILILCSELTLENFAGVFCVLACGLVIASLVAAVEIMQYVKYSTKEKVDIAVSAAKASVCKLFELTIGKRQ